jgi:hypothetical protein
MTWLAAQKLARKGAMVRRSNWSAGRQLTYWPPSRRTVAVIQTYTNVYAGGIFTNTLVTAPVKSEDFGAADHNATDWSASGSTVASA